MENRSLKECLHGNAQFSTQISFTDVSSLLQLSCHSATLTMDSVLGRPSEDTTQLEDQAAGCHRCRSSTGNLTTAAKFPNTLKND
jgi:hypothetical protein